MILVLCFITSGESGSAFLYLDEVWISQHKQISGPLVTIKYAGFSNPQPVHDDLQHLRTIVVINLRTSVFKKNKISTCLYISSVDGQVVYNMWGWNTEWCFSFWKQNSDMDSQWFDVSVNKYVMNTHLLSSAFFVLNRPTVQLENMKKKANKQSYIVNILWWTMWQSRTELKDK